jgi:hypothetical protein
MGARNQVGIWLSYRLASLCLATQFQTRFRELIPRHIAGLKFQSPLSSVLHLLCIEDRTKFTIMSRALGCKFAAPRIQYKIFPVNTTSAYSEKSDDKTLQV